MGFSSSTGAPITSPITGPMEKTLDKQCPACTPLPPPEHPYPVPDAHVRIQGPRILTCGTGANSETSVVCRLVEREGEKRKTQSDECAAPTDANSSSHYYFIPGRGGPLKLTGEDHFPSASSSSSTTSSTASASATASSASSVSNASLASAIGSEGGRREDLGKRREEVVGEWQGRMTMMDMGTEKQEGEREVPCRLPGGEWIRLN
ncbi:MAG: hypothetical protein Q9160_005728 [Pyrenula sp. 1 TL-2023]